PSGFAVGGADVLRDGAAVGERVAVVFRPAADLGVLASRAHGRQLGDAGTTAGGDVRGEHRGERGGVLCGEVDRVVASVEAEGDGAAGVAGGDGGAVEVVGDLLDG